MTPEQLERTLDGLLANARQMVRIRQVEMTIVRPQSPPQPLRLEVPPQESSDSDSDIDASPHTPPHLRDLPQVARIMPNQTGGLTIRPSVLSQQIRASSAATLISATLAQPVRRHLSWLDYCTLHIKIRAIGQKRFNAKCAERCGICMETHINGESTLTQCNHCFGQQCWKTWISNPSGNQSCPECRTPCPKTIVYSQRAERKTKQEKENV